jgi:hypothetical protein
MPSHPAFRPSTLLETNRRFLAYWLGKPEGGTMPRKSAIDPTEMPQLLPDLVLYERRGPRDFHIRLAGTAVVRRVGVNPTGSNVLDLLHPGSRSTLEQSLNRILDEPCAHVARVRDQYASGREAIVEVLRLPLRSEQGEPRFIISSTAETSDHLAWSDPHEKPELLAELLTQSFFGWRAGADGRPPEAVPLERVAS